MAKEVFWSALADSVIAGGGIITGAMLQQGAVVIPGYSVLVLAGITGVIMFAQHVKAHYAKAPPS